MLINKNNRFNYIVIKNHSIILDKTYKYFLKKFSTNYFKNTFIQFNIILIYYKKVFSINFKKENKFNNSTLYKNSVLAWINKIKNLE